MNTPNNNTTSEEYLAEIAKLKMENSLLQDGYFQLKRTTKTLEENIKRLKISEQHIKELNEVRNKFITIISHQLRTPLTAVNWNLEIILKGTFGKLEETQHKFLEVTHSASVEITRRINVLLTAIDIEEDRIVFEKSDVAIGNLCAGVVNGVLKKCELKNILCTYTPPIGDLPFVNGDGEKIRMVIATLIENAIIYTKDKGKILVKLFLKDNNIRFEVVDDGIGIPQSEQHFIFTRFFRASNASVMQPDAFGLELFVAKNFIEQHGGKIGFESKEGEGSTFWFEIPINNVKS